MDANLVIDQFQQFNRSRLERLNKLVSPKQHDFLSLLPILIHHNFSDLPAYGGTDCPFGIVDYQVDDDTITALQKHYPRFKYKRQGIRNYGFSALYLINRYGLLNLPSELSFDIVLVHHALSSSQQLALDNKLQLLSEWALPFGIQLNCILLDQETLASSNKPEILNDLYLNGLILAGAIPLWWLTAPNEPYPKQADIFDHQHAKYSTLNLGNAVSLKASDYAKALHEQLLQALDKGLSHCLDLIYLEQQLIQFPKVYPLCLRLRYALHKGETNPIHLDQQVLKLQTIQHNKAISANAKKLAQQSLYLAFKEALSKTIKQPAHPWRREFIKQLTHDWQWANHDFLILDRRNRAHFTQCLEEHEQTTSYFTQALTTLKNFCQQQQIQDLSLKEIEQTLYRYQQNKPNILSQLPSGITAKAPEEYLYFYRFGQESLWKLSLISLESESQSATYQARTYLELVAWAVINGLLKSETRILVSDKTQQITLKAVMDLSAQLLRTELAHATDKTIALTPDNTAPRNIASLHLFANLDPEHNLIFVQHQDPDIQLTTLHNDPFNYANRGANLLYQVDALLLTTQGEWQLFQFKGKQAPLQLLQYLISWWSDAKTPHPISCWSPAQNHSQLINHHLQQMVTDVNHYFLQDKTAQFVTQLAHELYVFHWQQEGADIRPLKSSHLENELATLNQQFISTYIDRRLDPDQKRFTLLSVQKPNTISIIIEAKAHDTIIHIVDELANLHHTHLQLKFDTALSHYQHFIQTMHQQQSELTIDFYQLKPFGINQWKLSPINLPQPNQKRGYLPVIIQMDSAKENANCIITCGPKQFSGLANNAQLLQQLTEFIMNLRASKIAYPLYINGITFTDPEQVTAADYIMQKHRFEQQLNQ